MRGNCLGKLGSNVVNSALLLAVPRTRLICQPEIVFAGRDGLKGRLGSLRWYFWGELISGKRHQANSFKPSLWPAIF